MVWRMILGLYARVENRKDLKRILDELFMTRTTQEWETAFEGSGIPYWPINTLENVFSHPQALARDMVQTVEQNAAVSGKVKVLGKYLLNFVIGLCLC